MKVKTVLPKIILIMAVIIANVNGSTPIEAALTPTEIVFNNYSIMMQVGDSFTVNATLRESGSVKPLITDAVLKVTISISLGSTSNETKLVSHDPKGFYVFTLTPKAEGMCTVTMEYGGDSTHSPASGTWVILVIPREPTELPGGQKITKISVHVSPSMPIVDSTVNIVANIEPPVPGAILSVSVTDPNEITNTTEVSTHVAGSYSLSVRLRKSGPWFYTVTYEGNEAYAASTSGQRGIIVLSHEDVDTNIEFIIMEKINAAPYLVNVTVTTTVYPPSATPLSDTTDISGICRFHKMTPGNYIFTFTKPGFVGVEESVTVNEGAQIHKYIQLARIGTESSTTSRGVPGYPWESIFFGTLACLIYAFYHARDF